MKKLILTALLGITSISAFSGTSCYIDSWGQTVCNGTGNDTGYKSRTYQDSWGRDITSDNQGNKSTCYVDSWGRYICN